MHAGLKWCTWPKARYAGPVWCTWNGAKAVHAGLQTRNSHTLILNIKKQLFHTRPYITLLDVLVLFMVPSGEEFPPISPLQLLILYPNLPKVLHCLEMSALLLVGH